MAESSHPWQGPVDQTNCEREPIHILGAIQGQGVLLALDPATLRVVQWSRNLPAVLRCEPQQLSGVEIDRLIDAASVSGLRQVVADGQDGHTRTLNVRWQASPLDPPSLGMAHLFQGVLILEVEIGQPRNEPFVAAPTQGAGTVPQFLQRASQAMQAAPTLDALYQTITERIRELSGFDRVMVYRFLEDGHGAVVGESVRDDLEKFFGLHYPASDIPSQARRLYELNPLRSIADLTAPPVPLDPTLCPIHNQPLDLTYSVFRSVSPIHIEYLRNMGVAASMSISILEHGRLWGLIACHHYAPRYLPLELRVACELFGTMAGNYVTSRALAETSAARSERLALLQGALQTASAGESLHDGFVHAADKLQRVMQSSGLAVCVSDRITQRGATPTVDVTARLRDLFAERIEQKVWCQDRLPAWTDVDEQTAAVASGVAVVRVGSNPRDVLLFFRPEYRHTVNWGGDPNKPVTQTAEGQKLSPRRSFAVWQETVHHRSREWTPIDHAVAEDLQVGATVLVARRITELQRLNDELTRINNDLDTFAYAASHDLREPLRGVHQLVFLLEQELGATVAERVRKRLEGLQETATRMDALIEALLRLSRAGRRDLTIEPIPVVEIVEEAADMSLGGRGSRGITVDIGNLPTLPVDFICVREIFINLLTNAVKYNDAETKTIQVSYVPARDVPTTPVAARGKSAFAVQDNGIGIALADQPKVFEIFRRLHLPNEYGGGTGAGLAIVRKIVERHAGVIWLDSEPGHGTTFYFTLGDVEPAAF
jgi:chemotaxis family two-component system sensor kinase Cph1